MTHLRESSILKPEKIKIRSKETPDTIGAEPAYFKKYLKNIPLKVMSNHRLFVRVEDITGEEWTIYNDQLIIISWDKING